jgi:plasmid segregation protein ParM
VQSLLLAASGNLKGGRNVSTTIIGLDIGYGYTKAVTSTAEVVFPSVVGQAERIRYESDLISENGRGIHLVTPDGERFVGELALLQSRIKWTPQDRGRVNSRTMVTLAQAAFSELGVSGEVALVTGLPVEWYGDREALTEQLKGRHVIRRCGGGCPVVNVSQVLVVPQPFGSLFALILDRDGKLINEDLARGRVGVIDVGMHTTDFVLVDRLRYVEKGSGSLTTALSRVHELTGRAILDAHSLQLTLHEVDAALRQGTVQVYGKAKDVFRLSEPALQAVAEEVKAKAGTLWGDGRDLSAVLVTGGGALALGHRILSQYPHAVTIPNAAMANVRGFLRYGMRKWASV